jgi:succinate dehydrogenase/fumarate reductase flavoprotein subunit
MKHVVLGLLLAVCVLFPHLFALAAAPLGSTALRLAVQPLVWAFVAGLVARPRIARRLTRSTS